MGDRVHVSVGALREAADRLAAVRDILADLHDLPLDAHALGDPRVASAAEEVQRGWHLHRAVLHQRLDTLAGYVDAASTAAQEVDVTVVTEGA